MAKGNRLAAAPWPVLLRQLRLRNLDQQPAPGCRLHRLRLGTPYSVATMDDHSLLADRRALRRLATVVHDPTTARHARLPPAVHATAGSELLPALPLALHFRTGRSGWRLRLAVRCPDEFRPTLQPSAVAAHRTACRAHGSVSARCSARLAHAGPCHGLADRRLGIDHLATPLFRHPDRPVAGLLRCLAVSDRHPPTATASVADPRQEAATAGDGLRQRGRRHRLPCREHRRRLVVAALAMWLAGTGGARLSGARRRILREAR